MSFYHGLVWTNVFHCSMCLSRAAELGQRPSVTDFACSQINSYWFFWNKFLIKSPGLLLKYQVMVWFMIWFVCRSSLTSTDTTTRCNATRLLAETINQMKSLPTEDLEPLCDFFCDRIKDHHSIVPHVLRAFLPLVSRAKYAFPRCTLCLIQYILT